MWTSPVVVSRDDSPVPDLLAIRGGGREPVRTKAHVERMRYLVFIPKCHPFEEKLKEVSSEELILPFDKLGTIVPQRGERVGIKVQKSSTRPIVIEAHTPHIERLSKERPGAILDVPAFTEKSLLVEGHSPVNGQDEFL